MATTTTRKTTTRESDDPKPLSKGEAQKAHDKAYGDRETAETPVPSDPALVQTPDGTATAAVANKRAQEKPAPEHVEAAAKSPTVPPYPHQVAALKAQNEAAAAEGQNVEPVGPGNSTDMTDRAAPAGDLPEHEAGTFLHGQTKEQVEATKRYSEPGQLPAKSVWVTNRQGEQFEVKGVKGRVETDGSLSILEGPLDPAVPPKVKKSFRAGQWSHWGYEKS